INKLGSAVRTIRIYGAMGIDLAYVASGKLDALINSGSDLYDFAPGVLLVREAGGVVVNFDGNDWSFKDKTILATNQKLVSQILIGLKN
ncbi:MAG: inositol monophosphatase family protein, partial [bacterium]|nr:inositol monophosphatase family protein [bacterium]